jgi:hypothetical protein
VHYVPETPDAPYEYYVVQRRRAMVECNFALGHIGQVRGPAWIRLAYGSHTMTMACHAKLYASDPLSSVLQGGGLTKPPLPARRRARRPRGLPRGVRGVARGRLPRGGAGRDVRQSASKIMALYDEDGADKPGTIRPAMARREPVWSQVRLLHDLAARDALGDLQPHPAGLRAVLLRRDAARARRAQPRARTAILHCHVTSMLPQELAYMDRDVL